MMNKITRFKHISTFLQSLAILAALLVVDLFPVGTLVAAAPASLTPASANASTNSTTYHVDANVEEAGDGSSWPTAFNDLQDALDVAAVTPGDIWVATGVYTPTKQLPDGGGPRTVTFSLVDGVKIYGGFAGWETSLEERQWRANPSVLDCDLNGDDDGFTNNGENCYHVVTASGIVLGENTLLDGFTIHGGNANGGSQHSRGGGIYNSNGAPRFQNLIITYNSASDSGGGMYNNNSNSALIGASFYKNKANYGGGLYNQYGTPWVVNSLFISNNASDAGGGIQNISNSPILINSVFSNNNATQKGGAIHNNSSSPLLGNLTIWKNSAGTSQQSGGGIFNATGSNPEINNVILWDNNHGQIISGSGSSPVIYKSLIQGGCPIPSCSGAILDSDPKFVDPYGLDKEAGTLDDNLRLRMDSPAIDAGDNNRLPGDTLDLDNDNNRGEELPIDADGRPRSVDVPFVAGGSEGTPVVDLGAYELRILFVDASASGGDKGSSWANAFTDLQTALEASFYGDSIWVADGVYLPTERTDPDEPRSASFTIRNGISVYGGFAGGETSPAQRNLRQNVSVLSGDLDGNDDGFTNNGENSFHVVRNVFTDHNTRLDGFRIQGGNANIESGEREGGGIFNNTSNGILANLTLYQNFAISGGGVYNSYVYNSYGDLLMINCKWIGNRAITGGGLRNLMSNPRLVNALFSGNSSFGGGGGAYNSAGTPTFINTTFSNNQADEEERIDEDGDGILNDTGAVLILDNSIVWGNQDQQVSNTGGYAEAHISFSIIQGGCPPPPPHNSGFTCLAVLNSNPLFTDSDGQDDQVGTPDDDLTLQKDSPAKDVGDNSRLPLDEADLDGDGDTSEVLPYDLDLKDRTIGADEPPTVDRGALEIPLPAIYLPLVIKS
jgi:hypothetical protein